jgi:hypothetical protein
MSGATRLPAALEVGDVYEVGDALRSRNLLVGVYVGQDANDPLPRFIGIREKFGYRYLTEEYGWPPFRRLGRVPKHATLTVSSLTLQRSIAQFQRRAL